MFKKISVEYVSELSKVIVKADKMVMEVMNMATEPGYVDLCVITNTGYRNNRVWSEYSIDEDLKDIRFMFAYANRIFEDIREEEKKALEDEQTLMEYENSRNEA